MSQYSPEGMSTQEITDQDKMMALLAYLIAPIVSIIILSTDTGRERSFQKFHAVQSLILWTFLLAINLFLICPIATVISLITGGLASCCFLPLVLVQMGLYIFYGIKAYQGEYAIVPVLTDLAHNAGWL